MDSSRDLMAFCLRMAGVMKGFGGRDGQVEILRGACLFIRDLRVVVKILR